MLKATMEIARITKVMELKFGIIVKPDSFTKNAEFLKIENQYSFNGNDYYIFKPNPFLVIDISKGKDKGEGWNQNLAISLNRPKLFEMVKKLKIFLNQYKQYTELFFYNDDKLCLNREIANKVILDLYTSNKHVRFLPSVVNGEGEGEYYEGCVFAINSLDNFCYLTYDEMEYLLYELERVNMNTLSFALLSLVKGYNKEIMQDKLIKMNISQQNDETKNEENTNESKGVTKITKNTLPL